MRKNDIKAGEEYGYKSYPSSEPQRVRVIEFDVARKVYSGSRDWSGHTVRDGILVEYLDKNGETVMKIQRKLVVTPGVETVLPNGVVVFGADTEEWVEGESFPSTTVVRSAQLSGTWEDAVKEIEARNSRRQNLANYNEAFKQNTAALSAALQKIAGTSMYDVTPTGRSGEGPFTFSGININMKALSALVELAEEAAKDF